MPWLIQALTVSAGSEVLVTGFRCYTHMLPLSVVANSVNWTYPFSGSEGLVSYP